MSELVVGRIEFPFLTRTVTQVTSEMTLRLMQIEAECKRLKAENERLKEEIERLRKS